MVMTTVTSSENVTNKWTEHHRSDDHFLFVCCSEGYNLWEKECIYYKKKKQHLNNSVLQMLKSLSVKLY